MKSKKELAELEKLKKIKWLKLTKEEIFVGRTSTV
jgi:hypothetical protein